LDFISIPIEGEVVQKIKHWFYTQDIDIIDYMSNVTFYLYLTLKQDYTVKLIC
jgi:hypothetical protein